MDAPDIDLLYRRYFGLIRAKCRRVLRDEGEAEDVAQETFVRLWKSNLSSQEPAAVVAWAYKTSTRLAVDHLRHGKVVAAHQNRPLALPPDPVRGLEARQTLARLAQVAPENELQAAVLCRIDGLDHKRAGELLDVSERTVRRLLASFDQRVAALRSPA